MKVYLVLQHDETRLDGWSWSTSTNVAAVFADKAKAEVFAESQTTNAGSDTERSYEVVEMEVQ